MANNIYDRNGMLRNDPGLPESPEPPQEIDNDPGDPAEAQSPQGVQGDDDDMRQILERIEQKMESGDQARQDIESLNDRLDGIENLVREVIRMQPNERKQVYRGGSDRGPAVFS